MNQNKELPSLPESQARAGMWWCAAVVLGGLIIGHEVDSYKTGLLLAAPFEVVSTAYTIHFARKAARLVTSQSVNLQQSNLLPSSHQQVMTGNNPNNPNVLNYFDPAGIDLAAAHSRLPIAPSRHDWTDYYNDI